ncbi:unnamed protein product [marine sediment metagenome]|uniref:Uncharacterized protein n=1 Tax=marine sediment metagenome TaxID=412755 RepID=X1HMJ6_9ZZZZ
MTMSKPLGNKILKNIKLYLNDYDIHVIVPIGSHVSKKLQEQSSYYHQEYIKQSLIMIKEEYHHLLKPMIEIQFVDSSQYKKCLNDYHKCIPKRRQEEDKMRTNLVNIKAKELVDKFNVDIDLGVKLVLTHCCGSID